MKTSLPQNSPFFSLFTDSLKPRKGSWITVLILFFTIVSNAQVNQNVTIDANSPSIIDNQTFGRTFIAGDTIFVSAERDRPLTFKSLAGSPTQPVVVINTGGQVKIDGKAYNSWGALTFENCRYLKVSGKGHPGYRYGFELSANQSGLSFSQYSSDCEAENIKISHDGFFGIFAKKDFGGNPPNPVPVFDNLVIHDCFIENVSEGMYIGETKSPGMDFKNLKIYNNIVRNTQRESIQVANTSGNTLIYNNTLINAGSEGLPAHQNNIQIGDNSVASIYNNIMMDAPACSVINFGKGDVFVYNNYLENSNGIFMDNRTISDTTMIMEVSQNYFKGLIGSQVIRNMNEKNNFIASNNIYDTDIPFYYDFNGVDNETISNNTLGSVAGIQFVDPTNNDYTLVAGTANEYLGMGAPSGPEYFAYTPPVIPVIPQIVVTPSMVTDNVAGGSVDSPLYLFDQQDVDIDANEEPIGPAWKPFYNGSNAPYHATVDLGEEYTITQINLHDMHDKADFVIEYSDGSNWITLITEPCDRFRTWKTHNVDVTTRLLRFSLYNSPYAAINEVIIYGYTAQSTDNNPKGALINTNGCVECDNYLAGEQFELNGDLYTVVDRAMLDTMIVNGDDLTKVCVSKVANMANLFEGNLTFNQNITNWDVSNVTSMNSMFKSAEMFNQSIGNWDTSLVTSMVAMFRDAKAFNQDISSWDVSNVTQMHIMFFRAFAFNQNIGNWDVSNVTNMNSMFFRALAFNQNIGSWNVSNVATMNLMFRGASTFNQDLSNWCVSQIPNEPNDFSTLSLLTNANKPNWGGSCSTTTNKSNLNANPLESLATDTYQKPVLYPNPVRDNINLKLPNANDVGNQNVKIFDASGNLVYSMDIDKNAINSDVQINANQIIKSSGLYMLLYQNDKGEKETIKFYKS